jgi:hypothetical protein
VLLVLFLLFGVIYVDLDTTDEGGVQSMVAVVFMTTIFTAGAFTPPLFSST